MPLSLCLSCRIKRCTAGQSERLWRPCYHGAGASKGRERATRPVYTPAPAGSPSPARFHHSFHWQAVVVLCLNSLSTKGGVNSFFRDTNSRVRVWFCVYSVAVYRGRSWIQSSASGHEQRDPVPGPACEWNAVQRCVMLIVSNSKIILHLASFILCPLVLACSPWQSCLQRTIIIFGPRRRSLNWKPKVRPAGDPCLRLNLVICSFSSKQKQKKIDTDLS